MVLVRENQPLLGKTFTTGVQLSTLIDEQRFYNQNDGNLNYYLFGKRKWWMIDDVARNISIQPSSAFKAHEVKFIGLFI